MEARPVRCEARISGLPCPPPLVVGPGMVRPQPHLCGSHRTHDRLEGDECREQRGTSAVERHLSSIPQPYGKPGITSQGEIYHQRGMQQKHEQKCFCEKPRSLQQKQPRSLQLTGV